MIQGTDVCARPGLLREGGWGRAEGWVGALVKEEESFM